MKNCTEWPASDHKNSLTEDDGLFNNDKIALNGNELRMFMG